MISSTDILQGKILIVDDQKANVLLLEHMLRGAGYDAVSSTMDSVKVCELHLENRYDLILLDLQMPEMDGFQVMENLKEIETGGYLPVLVITAQPEHKLRALKAGAKDFVSKPFNIAEVLLRVHNMLEVRLLHLETKKLYNRVLAEQKASEQLLHKILPFAILERLKDRPEVKADGLAELIDKSYAEVAVLFADIVEFTRYSEGASTEVIAGVLDEISARFDSITEKPCIDRSKTLGNAYLAGVGLPDAVADHSILAASMALDLIESLDQYNSHCRYKLKVSIGIETSEAKAGLGKRKLRFDL